MQTEKTGRRKKNLEEESKADMPSYFAKANWAKEGRRESLLSKKKPGGTNDRRMLGKKEL